MVAGNVAPLRLMNRPAPDLAATTDALEVQASRKRGAGGHDAHPRLTERLLEVGEERLVRRRDQDLVRRVAPLQRGQEADDLPRLLRRPLPDGEVGVPERDRTGSPGLGAKAAEGVEQLRITFRGLHEHRETGRRFGSGREHAPEQRVGRLLLLALGLEYTADELRHAGLAA